MQLNRNTLILLGICILVIIGGLVLQAPLQLITSQATVEPTSRTIVPDDISDRATQFTIRQGEFYTQMQPINDHWQITDATLLDTTREVNSTFITGVLDLLSSFEYDSIFESNDLAQFDLANPTTVIEIKTPTETYRLIFGNTNPDGDKIYMRINEEQTIYLMPYVTELSHIIRLALEPPYVVISLEATEEVTENILFPDVFGYQIDQFTIRDRRDDSFIRYTQGEDGIWLVEGTVVVDDREMDPVQAAINVSQFLFLQVDVLSDDVTDSIPNVSILTLTMTTQDGRIYTMDIFSDAELGFVGVLREGQQATPYALTAATVNSFANMVRQPPYLIMN